jgi:hypothetical protein
VKSDRIRVVCCHSFLLLGFHSYDELGVRFGTSLSVNEQLTSSGTGELTLGRTNSEMRPFSRFEPCQAATMRRRQLTNVIFDCFGSGVIYSG